MAYAMNPILRGFNPDPSILRVGEDYYIATSTFEWFPGVQIHHSKDLIHWELICHPLDRISQLNMIGNPSSGGIWAPCLSYCDGIYYLIFTDVKSLFGIFKDTHNYLVTANDIMGPWSEPIYLNSSGFDPSLFHDEDGRKWLVNMLLDHRSWNNSFAGIVLQEYSLKEQKLIGESKNIFRGTQLGFTEGPHLYKHDGFYYLLVAEGGTGYEHAASMARCRTIDGVYEIDPKTPIITSRYKSELLIQKSGHASIIDTPDGEWYMVHLCGRPLGKERMCILGRETSIQAVEWHDGWLSMKYSDNTPMEKVEIPYASEDGGQLIDFVEEFDNDTWNINLQSLRIPLGLSASLTKRRGHLRLYGGESMSSRHHQSLLAHRQQHFHFIADTVIEFNPSTFQQMAGLIYYYDNISYYYLHITYDEEQGKILNLLSSVLGNTTYPIGRGISLGTVTSIYLRLTCHMEQAQFSYSLDRKNFIDVGPVLDATVLSDDYYAKIGECRFTGAFIGICCQDLSGQKKYADFDYLKYKELEV